MKALRFAPPAIVVTSPYGESCLLHIARQEQDVAGARGDVALVEKWERCIQAAMRKQLS